MANDPLCEIIGDYPVETAITVYDEKAGSTLTIKPDPDGLGLITLEWVDDPANPNLKKEIIMPFQMLRVAVDKVSRDGIKPVSIKECLSR